jgi:hypothetical protein
VLLVLTVFEKIPDVFVDHYDSSFQVWAREFRSRGPKCAIPLDRKPGERVLLDGEGRAVMKGVWLVAEVDRSKPQAPRLVIRPADEQSEQMIAQHVREMAGVWLS